MERDHDIAYLLHVSTYSPGPSTTSSLAVLSSVKASAIRQTSENWSLVRYSVKIAVRSAPWNDRIRRDGRCSPPGNIPSMPASKVDSTTLAFDFTYTIQSVIHETRHSSQGHTIYRNATSSICTPHGAAHSTTIVTTASPPAQAFQSGQIRERWWRLKRSMVHCLLVKDERAQRRDE